MNDNIDLNETLGRAENPTLVEAYRTIARDAQRELDRLLQALLSPLLRIATALERAAGVQELEAIGARKGWDEEPCPGCGCRLVDARHGDRICPGCGADRSWRQEPAPPAFDFVVGDTVQIAEHIEPHTYTAEQKYRRLRLAGWTGEIVERQAKGRGMQLRVEAPNGISAWYRPSELRRVTEPAPEPDAPATPPSSHQEAPPASEPPQSYCPQCGVERPLLRSGCKACDAYRDRKPEEP